MRADRRELGITVLRGRDRYRAGCSHFVARPGLQRCDQCEAADSARSDAVERACAALAADRQLITFDRVADVAGVAKNTLFRRVELHAIVDRYRRQHPVAHVPKTGPVTGPLDLLAREWISDRRARAEIGEGSAVTQYWRLRQLLEMHGERPVEELDRRALFAWQEAISHMAPTTRRSCGTTASAFCQWLVAEGHLESDPSGAIAKVRLPRSVPRALIQEDVSKVLDACRDERESAIVWLMLGCGLRCCEISALDVTDYEPAGRMLIVRGKGQDERRLPVPPATAEALTAYRATVPHGTGPLIRARGSKSRANGRLSEKWISKLVSKLMVRAGVHRLEGEHRMGDLRSGHALRHTFATDCLAASGDIWAVKDLLGHSTLYLTQRYIAPADTERLRKAVEGRSYVRARPQTAPPIIPPEPRRPPSAPRPRSAQVDTCKLHCPRCCRDERHGPDCGGWQPIPVQELRVRGLPTVGYWYEATCPACRRRVSGDLHPAKAAELIERGATHRT